MLLDLLGGIIRWSRAKLGFEVEQPAQDGGSRSKTAPVPTHVPKAAAEVAVQNARIEMQRLAGGLQDVKNVAQWYQAMKVQIKTLHIANGALARGGWEQMSMADYKALEPEIARQYGYLRKFAEDVATGKYGANPAQNRKFLIRSGQYADSGRAVYENERAKATQESFGGQTESKRLLGGSGHCQSCLDWAALGWIPTEIMLSQYPIGSGQCHANCHCVIITRRVQG